MNTEIERKNTEIERKNTIRAASARVDALTDAAHRRQFALAVARARTRARINRVVRRPGMLFGSFVAGVFFGMLPTPPMRRLRKGVNRLPGGLMSVAVIALRMQSAFSRVARGASRTPESAPEGALPSRPDY